MVLERWTEGLGQSQYVLINEGVLLPTEKSGEISGWYARYDEGTFAYWRQDERDFVSWRKKVIELSPATMVEWSSTASGRHFKVEKQGVTKLTFSYYTLLRRPWRMLTELLIPDDDWGLVFDLPSFVHSCFISQNFDTHLEQWNAANDT